MKRITTGALFLTLLFASSVTLASPIKSSSLEQLMTLSGLNKELAGLPDGMKAGVQQAKQKGTPLSDAQFNKIEQAIVSAFKPANITRSITDTVKSNVSESEAQQLLAWYKSDLGRKITKAEDAGSNPKAYQDMLNQAEALLADKERVKIAQKIESLVNATDMMVEFQKNAAVTIYTSLSKAMNPGEEVDLKAFEDRFAAQEAQMRQQFTQFAILSMVYSYKEITIPELNKYVEFLQQPYTTKFNTSIISGMKTGLTDAVKTMAASLAKTFTAQK